MGSAREADAQATNREGTAGVTVLDRFWAKVDDSAGPDGCWPWTAAINPNGYGRFSTKGRGGLVYVHVFAYELATTERVPDGLEIDHRCRNRACCNAQHLEAVTHAENMRRGEPASRTHCPQGHAYDEANTYRWRGSRKCRRCHRDVARRARRRRARVAA